MYQSQRGSAISVRRTGTTRHKLLHLMRGISKGKRGRLETFPLSHSVFCKLFLPRRNLRAWSRKSSEIALDKRQAHWYTICAKTKQDGIRRTHPAARGAPRSTLSVRPEGLFVMFCADAVTASALFARSGFLNFAGGVFHSSHRLSGQRGNTRPGGAPHR